MNILNRPKIETHYGLEILPDLKEYHGDNFHPEILSVKIMHIEFDVFVDIHYQNDTIFRSNLEIISGEGLEPLFQTRFSLVDNGANFINLDIFTLSIISDKFFNEAALD